jgi:membrane-bound lytic murein transglycosylase D
MRLRQIERKTLLCAVAGVFLTGAGCDDAAKRMAQSRPPAIQPDAHQQPASSASPQQSTANQHTKSQTVAVALANGSGPLPFRHINPPSLPNLAPPPISAAEFLFAYSQTQFDAGQTEYRAGHLAAARKSFDMALDAMLASGLDIEHDAKLGPLYQKIVETVSSEEFAAFREGDGFTGQKVETAPLDEIPEMTVPPTGASDPKLTANAEREVALVPHDLPLTVNQYVLAYVNFFQTPRGRAIVETGLRRAGKYRPMIEKVLREEGLPQDLIYMAQAESAFQPVAISKARAVGLWQFMAGRGKEYGLERTWWVDERQDPEKATRAAAKHLRDLYGDFNDWYLAIAAYDTGPGNVQKAIERTGYADFWQLYERNVLLKETRNYVPIILALALIAKDPPRYGIQVTPDPPVDTEWVKPGHPIDLRLVAETIDVDVETLRAINPELLRMVTPPDANYEMRLPAGSAERFRSEIAEIPADKWVSWRRHRVEEGETLGEIARKYHVTPAAIADANGLESSARIESGDKLIIPATARTDMQLGKLTRYRVRRGDTLPTIADQFSVTSSQIIGWNHLKSAKVSRGMVLRVYPGGMRTETALAQTKKPVKPGAHVAATAPKPEKPAAETSSSVRASSASVAATRTAGAGGSPVIHKVQPGETVWGIAHSYNTTTEALRNANKFLFSRPLQVGDQLTILPKH